MVAHDTLSFLFRMNNKANVRSERTCVPLSSSGLWHVPQGINHREQRHQEASAKCQSEPAHGIRVRSSGQSPFVTVCSVRGPHHSCGL